MDSKRPTVAGDTKPKKMTLDPGNVMLVVYTLLIALIILCGGLLQADATEQQPDLKAGEMKSSALDDIRQGVLLAQGPDGSSTPALRLDQNVKISISGIAARVQVSQDFENTSDAWIDGVYVFPLPDESAVDRLRMQVGDREIVGEIKEREEAKAIYEKAKQEGKKTSLLAQNRPNIFTTRVANIGPGERVTIVIEYQQAVQFTDTVFSLRFPMAITPRYIPGNVNAEVEKRSLSFTGEGWAKDTDRVPDASQISPPVASPESGEGPTTKLTVDLMSGFALTRLESLYHQMDVKKLADDAYSLTFTGKVLADRDFVLEWQPEKVEQASAALLSEEQGENRYLLLMLMPPQGQPEVHVPREAIYILDISGSMAGPSIVQAKEALRRALKRLRPVDRFNVISFSDSASALFAKSMPASDENIAEALSHLNALEADGGTEMRSALELALDGSGQRERIRQVIFLTDGAVGNEEELLALISKSLGDARFFTVGIGSAPNGYFMTRAAGVGRGTYTYIGDINEVQTRMDQLLSKLETPALTDITIRSTDGKQVEFESFPNPITDLYVGEPLMVAVRSSKDVANLTVAGEQLGKGWEYAVDTTSHGSRPGIAALWARKKIRSEMDTLALGGDEENVKKVVLATALEHQLVSKYTSLVAVDKMVSRPQGALSQKQVVKTAAPHGMDMEAVFGGGAKTATPSALHVLFGTLLFMAAGLLHVARRRVWNR